MPRQKRIIIPNTLKSHIVTCTKKTDLMYKYLDKPNLYKSWQQFEKYALKRHMTLIAYDVYKDLIPSKDFEFQTVLPGDPKPEQTFHPIPHHILVVGPLGEVYHTDLNSKFMKVKSHMYSPISEERHAIAITPRVFAILQETTQSITKPTRNYIEFKTAWGATHIMRVGDYAIVEGNIIAYRIHGQAFENTYTIA